MSFEQFKRFRSMAPKSSGYFWSRVHRETWLRWNAAEREEQRAIEARRAERDRIERDAWEFARDD
jgi:hypothetical protein